MTAFLILGVLFLIWAVGKGYLSPSPKALAKQGRSLAGFGALALAAFMGVRGAFDVALVLGGVGAWLLGHDSLRAAIDRWTGREPGPKAMSRIRTPVLTIEIELQSGIMQGEVLAGPSMGRTLASLSLQELFSLMRLCVSSDPLASGLLETYLDRRFPGWREDIDFDLNARQAGAAQPSVMTAQEAYQVLGLETGASADDVRGAYRALMKKLHPDHGGTTYLAARINEAKEVLLSRHR